MKKEEKVLMEVYRAVYKELGVELDKLIEDGTTKEDMWFMQFEMSRERQEEILNDILGKSRLSKHSKQKVSINYWLGGSPKSV